MSLQMKLADQLKVADQLTLNINFNFAKLESSKPTTIITATAHHEKHPTSLLVEEDNHPLRVTSIPFQSGTHLMIDNPSWWDSENHVLIGHIKCIPISVDQLITFEGIERPAETFTVKVGIDEKLIFSSGSGTAIEIVQFDSTKGFYLGGGSEWSFVKYTPDQVIRFADIPGILLSLVEGISCKAIVIRRKNKSLSANEYYVLVF